MIRIPLLIAAGLLGCTRVEPPPDGRDGSRVPPTTRSTPVASADARERDEAAGAPLLGLLRLPEVFGGGPCDRAAPTPVRLYAQAAVGASIGTIEVATPWTHHAEGGCSGLEVVSRAGAIMRPLPTREIAYEEPAAIVVGRSGNEWFRVRLDDTTAAWVQVTTSSRFASIDDLVIDGQSYLTEAWDGRLASEPGATPRAIAAADVVPMRFVRVVATRRVDGRHWARVEVLGASPCEAVDVRAVDAGWVPLHDAAGAPTVWFHARGC